MISRKPVRSLWVIIFCFFGLCFIMACASQGQKPVSVYVPPSENVLRVGVSPDAAPLVYKQGEEIVGLEAELAQELAKSLGKSVHFVELDWEDQIPALQDNRTDIIMSGMSITTMRRYRIAFSEPYFRIGQMPLVRKGDETEKSLFAKGVYAIIAWTPIMRIGVLKGTTGEYYVRKRLSRAKEIISFPTANEAVSALKKGDFDLFIYDAPMIYMLAAENEADLQVLDSLLTEEYLAWGMRKNDADLLESANAFIEALRNDGRLDRIINRWIPFKH